MTRTFTYQTEIPVTPATFWQRMSMDAVNAELRPLVRMTVPSELRRTTADQWVTGRLLFRSVILLFGVLPVDVHLLRLERLEPGRGFLERSSSWVNRVWRHERNTTPTASGCIVTDIVTVESRIPGMAALMLPVYRWVFRHRHRRLRRLYGPYRAGEITP